MAKRGSFYEDDEPLEKLETAFERGRKVVSRAPATGEGRGWNRQISLQGLLQLVAKPSETQAARTR